MNLSRAFVVPLLLIAIPFPPVGAQLTFESPCDSRELLPLAADEEPGAEFGRSVDTDESALVVGAPLFDAGGLLPDAGRVTIYEQPAGSWALQTTVDAADRASGDRFGESVAVDGGLLVVGAPGTDDAQPVDPQTDSGSAYIFSRTSPTSWIQVQELTDSSAGDELGASVAINGTTIVVGAWGSDTKGTDAGAAYVYVPDPANPGMVVLEAVLHASDAASGDRFGHSVAISGDTIVVGAPGADVAGASDAGAAYAFVLLGSGLVSEQAKLTSPAPGLGAAFGAAVAVDGDVAVIGAPHEAAGLIVPGQAYGFARTSTVWGSASAIAPIRPIDGMEFGAAVDVRGIVAAVGAPRDRFAFGSGRRTGSTHLYVDLPFPYVGWHSSIKLRGVDTLDDELDGASLALGSDFVVTGAPRHTDGRADDVIHIESGAAFVHPIAMDVSGIIGVPDYVDIAAGSLTNANGNCTADELELGVDPDFDVVVHQAGDQDGPGAGSGQEAFPRADLADYLAAAKPSQPRLDFDDVPGEGGVSCDVLFGHSFTDLPLAPVFATLEIGISASPSCSSPSDDFLALELEGAGTFLWWRRLRDLPTTPGGPPLQSWSNGDSAVFTLDLTSLPLLGGGTTDLVSAMNDGDLDVLVGEHSSVDYACLIIEVFQPVRQYMVRYDAAGGLTHGTIEAAIAALPELVSFVRPDAAVDAYFAQFTVVGTKNLPASILGSPVLAPVIQTVERVPIKQIVTGPVAASGGTATCPLITLQDAFERMGTDDLHDMGLTGDLNPLETVRIGMLDQHLPAHADLCGRLTPAENVVEVHDHATRVAGILAGDGLVSGGVNRGVAPEALLYAWSRKRRSDLDIFQVVPGYVHLLPIPGPEKQWKEGVDVYGVDVFNNSWGWFDGTNTCTNYGRYVLDCPLADQIIRDPGGPGPGPTIVFAAGNERTTKNELGGCDPFPWQTILPSSSAKNIITVGAAVYGTPLRLTDRSSFGPTADGRLKPDVVGISGNYMPGTLTTSPAEVACDRFPYDPEALTWLFPTDPALQKCDDYVCDVGWGPPACDNYARYNDTIGGGATSWATPQVAGIAALLIDRHRELFSRDPPAVAQLDPDPALLKALLCNTATDMRRLPIPGVGVLGPDHHTDGPDYQSGYGLVDAAKAHASLVNQQYLMGQISAGETLVYELDVSAGEQPVLLPAAAASLSGRYSRDEPLDLMRRLGELPAETTGDPEAPPGAVPSTRCELRVLLAWSDLPCRGGPAYDCNDPDPEVGGALINDLDLSLLDPAARRFLPWTLEPSAPEYGAKRRVNRRDNVEQVTVSPPLTGTWTVTVDGFDIDPASGPQSFALVWWLDCNDHTHEKKGAVKKKGKAPKPKDLITSRASIRGVSRTNRAG